MVICVSIIFTCGKYVSYIIQMRISIYPNSQSYIEKFVSGVEYIGICRTNV